VATTNSLEGVTDEHRIEKKAKKGLKKKTQQTGKFVTSTTGGRAWQR